MTTIRPALDAAARAADRRPDRGAVPRVRGVPRGPLPAQERPPRRRLRREVPGPPGSGGDERAVRVLRRARPRPRRRAVVDLVAGPTTGGVILAFETARQLGVRSIFAEEVRDDDGTTRREFRRGFRIEPGERVLLVDDILTTGGSLLAMLPGRRGDGRRDRRMRRARRSERRARDADVAGDRPRYPLRSLWQLDLPTYEPGRETCPRCADGTPLHAPGSTGTRPREHGPRAPEDVDSRTPEPLRAGAGRRHRAVDRGGGVRPERRAEPARGPAGGHGRPSTGVVVAVDSDGLDRRQRLHAPDDRRRARWRSRSATSRTAPSSRRATSSSTRRPLARSGSGTGPRATIASDRGASVCEDARP